MPPYKEQGVVLRSIKLGEADKIVTIMTQGSGKVRAVAKGIRKTTSRFGARLEPFTHVNLMLYRGRGSLDTVTQAEILAPHRAIRDDLGLFAAGETMLEAVDKVAEEHEKNLRLVVLLLARPPGARDPAGRPRRGRRVVPAEAPLAVRVPSEPDRLRRLRRAVSPSSGRPGSAGRSARADADPASAPVSRDALGSLATLAHADLVDAGTALSSDPRPVDARRIRPTRDGRRAHPARSPGAAVRVRRVPLRAADALGADAREDGAVSSYLHDIDPRPRARSRRDRDGRQRPLGPAARAAADRGPRRRRGRAVGHGERRGRGRGAVAHRLRVLHRELGAAAARGALPHELQPEPPPSPPRRAPSDERSDPIHGSAELARPAERAPRDRARPRSSRSTTPARPSRSRSTTAGAPRSSTR